jgi:hypothetical protein
MAINPELITTIRVDQLPDGTLNLTNKIPHTSGTVLEKASVQELVDLVATAVGVSGGVGYIALSVTDGQQLPDVPELPSFFLCGAGTFLNINGYPNIICTENLNAIMSLTDHWELAVEIPINPLSGTVESVTGSAVDNTDPLNPVINITGGAQTLAEVLLEGNITDGTDISISDGDKIVLDNGANLKKGTTDAGLGGTKGIALRCAVDYELKWEAGRLYVMGGDGFTIREVSHNFTTTPTVTDDDTKGFVVDSRWILDNGDVYVCTDDTTGAAVWELVNTGTTPTLPQVLNAGNREVKIWDFSVDGNYTFEAVDKGKFLVFTGGNGYDITIPNGTFDVGDVLLMFDVDGGNQIFQDINGLTPTQYSSCYTITCVDVDVFIFSFEVQNYSVLLNELGFYSEPLIITGNITAINNRVYSANGTLTVTDPTPVTNKGYIVHVIGGTTTIGGVGYTTGDLVYRFYNGSSWLSTNMNSASGVTSVGLTMPSAFSVTNSPITSSGDIAVTGAGLVSQYVRGDGTLANFPASTGGGASLSFYLNGSVSQGTIGGVAFREMDRIPILGAGTDFTINADGYIQSFITDAGVPNLLEIPAGNWNFETYFSASSGGGSPSFYIELYKWNGTTLSLIASNSATPRLITDGTNIEAYFSALAVPQTTLLATDRLAIRIYVTHSGRTITLHTENSHLCQVITTFSTGLTALNGLTAQVQNLSVGTSGTDFAISSLTDTHTFNLPTASASNRGALSSTDWSTFNNKQDALGYTPYRFNAPTQIVHTGTTAETILQTILIPGNTFTDGDFLVFSALVSKLANIGNTTHTLKVNTTNTLTGATTISTAGFNTVNLSMKFKREMALNGGNAYLLNISNNTQNDQTINSVANVMPSFTYNLAADLYFFVTCTLSNATDTITYRGLNLYKQ